MASVMDKQIKSLTRPPENKKTGKDQTRSAAELQIQSRGKNKKPRRKSGLGCSGGTDGTRTRDPLRDRQVF